MSRPVGETGVVRGALAASAVLLVAAPSPWASLRTLAASSSADVLTDPLVALVALLAWCCAAYLLLVAALTVGTRLPGAAGRALGALVRRAAPAGLRRALELALGASLVVGGLGGGTAVATPPGASGSGLSAQSTTAPVVPDPLVAPVPGSLDHPASAPTPSLDHPVAAAPTPSLDHPLSTPAPSLDHPVTGDGAAATVTATSTGPAASAEPVVVQPGDSLWSLAEDHLEQQTGARPSDAAVAQAWPSWWQANREQVGDDPDLLHPGTPLTPPDSSPRPPSS